LGHFIGGMFLALVALRNFCLWFLCVLVGSSLE
jgi:hypothetical protein